MASSTISIEVDQESARAFREAPVEEQRKLQVLLGLRLRELTTMPRRSLKEIMDDIGHHAEAQGMTPEILEGCHDSDH